MKFLSNWRTRKPADDAETVYVSEKFGVRSLHIGSDTIQSSMRIARPNDLDLSYTRSMMGFLLFNRRPGRVLMVGLGGGSLAKFIYHRMPWAVIEVVEINPRVIAVARQYFHVPQDDARFTVVVGDGAEHMARHGCGVDLIAVDGYGAESQAEQLSAKAFYDACRRRLNAGGMLVVNLWGSDRNFNKTLQRIEGGFPAGTVCLPAAKPGNIIAFGFKDNPGDARWDDLAQRAEELERLYGLEFPRFVEAMRKMNRHDQHRLFV
ncbi:MAG: spermidine synthase [Betaproteobacteria bacterium RIFCSPLOWO2_12_FULL_62_13]|nr:MAG: spermidine synthase [Betaproteobacteria bacterium RIFCSPLOWO2_12_FULL_62_13]